MILATGDIHLNDKSLDTYRHDWQEQLRKLAHTHNAKAIVLLGDLTDAKDFHSAALVNKVVDHLWRLSKVAPVITVKGNHDYTAIEETPFFAFLSHVQDVYWIGKPTFVTPQSNAHLYGLLGRHTLFLPHTPNYKRDWGKGLQQWDATLIFGHNTFEGSQAEDGSKLNGIPLEELPADIPFVSGDIHTPQTIGTLTYAGAPYTINFGEDYNPRLLLIGNKIKSIPSPGPQKRLLTLKPDLTNITFLDNVNKGDIVKIRINLAAGDYARWSTIKSKVEDWAYKKGYILYQVQPILPATTPAREGASAGPRKTDKQVFEEYVKAKQIDKYTAKVGMDLLEEHSKPPWED